MTSDEQLCSHSHHMCLVCGGRLGSEGAPGRREGMEGQREKGEKGGPEGEGRREGREGEREKGEKGGPEGEREKRGKGGPMGCQAEGSNVDSVV